MLGLLASCSSGPEAVRSSPYHADETMALLVIYRPGSGIGEASIAIDNGKPCGLGGNGLIVQAVKPGRHTVTADNSMSPGLSVLKMNATAGQTLFVRVAMNKGRLARGLIPIYGWVNSFVEAEQNRGKPHGNLFSLDQMPEAEAVRGLEGSEEINCLAVPEN
jgi:hypothetical protein